MVLGLQDLSGEVSYWVIFLIKRQEAKNAYYQVYDQHNNKSSRQELEASFGTSSLKLLVYRDHIGMTGKAEYYKASSSEKTICSEFSSRSMFKSFICVTSHFKKPISDCKS